ncbi:AFG1/ZapE family ATPase, partial [Francisella tularensis subsp. holarctica]|uniref:AFG1/ZapE family ATPase n=1 Tax=Francisella tularensis TaxID=263 RepID=UPI002381C8B8
RRLQEIVDQLYSKKKYKLRLFKKSFYTAIKGLYMWGGVGLGKTFIMDIFYNNLTIKNKKRQHFSQFMKNINTQLRKYQGEKNPISKVA